MSISSPGQPLESWKEPFKRHSISDVHRKERELRSQANGKKQQLRGLVGQSYRGLLGTANTIMTMHENMLLTCHKVDGLSERCDARSFSYKADLSCRYERKQIIHHHARNVTAARLELLRGIPFTVNSLCKYAKDVFSAAKLYVAAKRLLKLTDDGSAVYIEIKPQYIILERRLMRFIDEDLLYTSHNSDKWLSNAILAFYIVSPSSLPDAIRYVLRLWAMQLKSQQYSEPKDFKFAIELAKECLNALRTFTDSVDLSDCNLNTRPDGDLQWLFVDTESYREFLPLEFWQIQGYLDKTLDPIEIKAILQSTFCEYENILELGLSHFLSTLETLDAVCSARQNLMKAIYSALDLFNAYNCDVYRYTRQIKSRMVELIQSHGMTIGDFNSRLAEILKYQSSPPQEAQWRNLWQFQFAEIPVANGGDEFIAKVKSICDGKGPSDEILSNVLEEWQRNFQNDFASLQNLRHQHALDVDEDDEIRGDLKLDTCVGDAEELLSYQHQCAVENAILLFRNLTDIVQSTGYVKNWDGCIMLLRAFHMAKSRLSSLPGGEIFEGLEQPDAKTLHLRIAELVVGESSDNLSRIPRDSISSEDLHSEKLWSSGQPSLPTQPSPSTLKYVTDMAARMTSLESTIVQEELVETVKSTARHSVQSYLETTIANERLRKTRRSHQAQQMQENGRQSSESNRQNMEDVNITGTSHTLEENPISPISDLTDLPSQADVEDSPAKMNGVKTTLSLGADSKKVQFYFDLCFLSVTLHGLDETSAMYLVDLPSSVSLTEGLTDREKSCEKMQEKARDFVRQTALLTVF